MMRLRRTDRVEANGRNGEWAKGRSGETAKGRHGEWAMGRNGEGARMPYQFLRRTIELPNAGQFPGAACYLLTELPRDKAAPLPCFAIPIAQSPNRRVALSPFRLKTLRQGS
jgi:hypothetical protein